MSGLTVDVSSPSSAVDCAPVGGRAQLDVPDWADDIGDRSSGGMDVVSAGDTEGSPTCTLERPRRRVGVAGGPSLVAVGDVMTPCSSCGARGTPEEVSALDGTGLTCCAGGVDRSPSCYGGAASDDCLLARSPVGAAARVRALVLVEMSPSVCAPFSVRLRSPPSSTLPRLPCGLRFSCLASLLTGSTSMGSLFSRRLGPDVAPGEGWGVDSAWTQRHRGPESLVLRPVVEREAFLIRRY